MATADEDSTAAAATAQLLGSMSLEESAETKDNGTEAIQKNEDPAKFCSACGKESDALKKCTACKCVWYCDKKCQHKHRKGHKNECRLIKEELEKRGGKLDVGTEKDIGPLGKVPAREECPICMRVQADLRKLTKLFRLLRQNYLLWLQSSAPDEDSGTANVRFLQNYGAEIRRGSIGASAQESRAQGSECIA